MNEEKYHRTIMLKEVLDLLKVQKDHWYLDGTFGDGGHSLGILKQGGKVIAVDQDPEAIKRATQRLSEEGFKEDVDFKTIKSNFREYSDQNIDGAILDLGVSTLQLKTPERGFSFALEGNLDMRMDPNLGVTAADLINALNKGELYELFKNYGEEKFAYRISEEIIKNRPFNTTKQLADLIEKVVPRKFGDIHPATQVFQALRIAVNDELEALKESLPKILEKLNSNSVLVIITFHSLEDRIVKFCFKEFEEKGYGEILTEKPIDVSDDEVRLNPRARSAKIRAFKKK